LPGFFEGVAAGQWVLTFEESSDNLTQNFHRKENTAFSAKPEKMG